MRKPSWKFHSKILTGFKFAHFPKPLLFQKKALKTNKFWKIRIFFCISGGNFIGLFNGILFVFILSVVVDTQKETSQLYCCKISIGHHCTVFNNVLAKGVWKIFFFWFYGRFQKFGSFHEEKSYFWQKFEAIRTFLGGLLLAILPYFCHF